MAYANVQMRSPVVEVSTYDGSIGDVFSSNPSVGNLIIVTGGGGSEASTWSVSDNKGNSYSIYQNALTGNIQGFIAYAVVASTGSTFTVTAASSAGVKDMALQISEWSGNASSPVLDVSAVNADVGIAITTTTATLATAGELLISVLAGDNSYALTSAPSGYTSMASVNGISNSGFKKTFASAYKVSSGTSAESAAWPDYDAGSTWVLIAAFKIGATGPTDIAASSSRFTTSRHTFGTWR